MVIYYWVAWHARNCFVFEGNKLDLLIFFAKAEAVIEAYQRVSLTGQTHINKKATGFKEKWHPPPRNVSKINVDATINKQNQQARLGVVIRDSNSKIMVAVVKTSKQWKGVAYAEAEAME